MQECQEDIAFLEVDWVAVKGREQPVAIFQPLGVRGEVTPAQSAAGSAFATGLACYRRGEFHQAAGWFQRALEHWPDHGPSQVLGRRCQERQGAPPEGWDAVFRPDSK